MPLYDFGIAVVLMVYCEVIVVRSSSKNCTCLPEKAIFTCEHVDTVERGVHNVKRYFDSTLFHPKWLAIAQ